MSAKRGLRLAIAGGGLAALTACSLSQAPGYNNVSLDLSNLRIQKTRHAILPDPAYVGQFDELSQLLETSAPETIGGFSCFGINVTAQDIPSTNPAFSASYSNDPDCTYPGVSSSLVQASASGASLQLDVPVGPQRLIQVIGLQSTAASCPAGLLTDHIFDSSITGAYELGRAVGDITEASSVTIQNRFTPDNLKKPFACPVMQLYAYTISSDAPLTDVSQTSSTCGNRGYGHGIINGYKVDRTTGALTPIPGATQTTHGNVDLWGAIAVSNAGKWLYAFVDDDTSIALADPPADPPTNQSPAEVDVYSIDAATGDLTFVQRVSTPGQNQGSDCNYGSVAIDPYDQILFVGYGDSVAAYQIDQATGALLASPQILAGAAESNSGFVIAPGGNAIYTPAVGDIVGFSVGNGASSLAALNPPSYDIDSGGSNPYQLTINPEGRFLYSANQDLPGQLGISQFAVNDDGTLTLIPGPADPGIAYPKVLVDPYYGATLYGADVTRDGINAFPIRSNGTLGAMVDSAVVPDTTVVNTVNDVEIDPWSNFLIAAYDSGHLVTFGLKRDGTFSGTNQLYQVSSGNYPFTAVIALVPQPQ